MLLGTGQGVAVAHHARCRVIPGNGQGVAQARGDRLTNTGHHTSRHHVDATHTEVVHPVRCQHGKAALLSQSCGVAGRPQGQIGLIQNQLGGAHIQPGELYRTVFVDRRDGWIGRQATIATVASPQGVAPTAVQATHIAVRQFRNAIETGSGKTNHRINPIRHFGKQHKTVATAQCAWRAVAAISRGRGFGVDTRVVAGGNRPLNTLDIAQLRLARRNVLSLYRGCLVSQELLGHRQAAVAAECQLGAIIQAYSHGACEPRLQLLARI